MKQKWSINDAQKLYGISNWGAGYFGIDDLGCLTVSPDAEFKPGVRMTEIIEEARKLGLEAPLHVRFQDILHHRVQRLNEAFAEAISEHDYQASYQGVYPIKVNQLREVVEALLEAGDPYKLGIEAGSKPELLLALSLHKNYQSLLLCNGYKDETYIRYALAGLKLGKKVIIIVEKLEELPVILEVAAELKVRPMIGLRVKLATRSSGQWATSSGDNAKFGLSSVDILQAIELLTERDLLDTVKLLHFHIGSQIPEINVISRAVREGARFYAKLAERGCTIEYVDVGGGLGIDYDGSASSQASSVNYSLREYASAIICGLKEVCNEEKVVQPTVITESGRALVAHHSVLVIESFGKIHKQNTLKSMPEPASLHRLVQDVLDIRKTLAKGHLVEAFHDLVYYKQQALSLFDLGFLDLESRAVIDSLYWEIGSQIAEQCKNLEKVPHEIKTLLDELKDQYLMNFSVFRSLIDFWALGQNFPIVPLDRLEQKPDCEAILADITCDSDGKIDRFIGAPVGEKNALLLHNLDDKPYFLGVFLTGAYQDTLGDMHNLFGRMNEVHIVLDPDEEGGWYVDQDIAGDKVDEMLTQNEYSVSELVRAFKAQVDQAIKSDRVRPSEGVGILNDYEKAMSGYTYLSVSKK